LEDAAFESLRDELRRRLAADPPAAYRDWYAVQRELAARGDAGACRGLADDLWELLPRVDPSLEDGRGKFFNDLGAFFGSPGPAADLGRADACFARAIEAWAGDDERRARALHNRGSALAALGADPAALARAVSCLEEALVFRNGEREIARAVTLHHLGIALRKLAESAPEDAAAGLERSRAALEEALAIRRRQGLAAGAASTRFQLAATLSALGRNVEARETFREAAEALEAAGRSEEAALARRLSEPA
jgi:tetratricopeptide (TPR) repeat protein